MILITEISQLAWICFKSVYKSLPSVIIVSWSQHNKRAYVIMKYHYEVKVSSIREILDSLLETAATLDAILTLSGWVGPYIFELIRCVSSK
jgi:hypothetical protein